MASSLQFRSFNFKFLSHSTLFRFSNCTNSDCVEYRYSFWPCTATVWRSGPSAMTSIQMRDLCTKPEVVCSSELCIVSLCSSCKFLESHLYTFYFHTLRTCEPWKKTTAAARGFWWSCLITDGNSKFKLTLWKEYHFSEKVLCFFFGVFFFTKR